jgi:hypothetical protein
MDEEGVTFTFDLASVLHAEGKRRNVSPDILLPLTEYLERVNGCQDRWGTAIRARSARAAALFRQEKRREAFAEMEEAENLEIGFAGYATMALIALANRWVEFGQSAMARELAIKALNRAERVLDAEFREERVKLVGAYQSWLDEPAHTWNAVSARMAALPDPDIRMAYVEHLSARWAAPDAVDVKGLSMLIPLVLSDGTTLDAVLGRLFGVILGRLDETSLANGIRTCAKQLTTGRPWELGS